MAEAIDLSQYCMWRNTIVLARRKRLFIRRTDNASQFGGKGGLALSGDLARTPTADHGVGEHVADEQMQVDLVNHENHILALSLRWRISMR